MRLYLKQTFIDKIRSQYLVFGILLSFLNRDIQPAMNQLIIFDHSHSTTLPLLIFSTQGVQHFLNLIQNLFRQFKVIQSN
jgi:hypothetical protein